MGNLLNSSDCHSQFNFKLNMKSRFVPVNEFEFMEPFEDESTNGLYLNDIYLPEEVIVNILSYVPPKNLLALTLVCKRWCNIIKSQNIWINIYNRHYPAKAKALPWYIYYCYFTTNNFNNMLKNGNGQEQFKYWQIMKNLGDEFIIEDPPSGSDPLPHNVDDFKGYTSCFATSYGDCNKIQKISLRDKRLLRYILNKFTPHIYVSEWVAGRFDCGCMYRLMFKGYDETFDDTDLEDSDDEDESSNRLFSHIATKTVEQWQGNKWEKIELLIQEYPLNVAILIFGHEGCDTQFWKGHYGSKMAGGVVKFVFDSIRPLDDLNNDVREPQEQMDT